MKCTEAEKSILLQDSGELGSAGMLQLEEHLAGCDACQAFKQVLTASSTTFRAAEEPSLKTVQDVLRMARVHAPVRTRHHLFGWKPAVAMAAVAVAALGLFLGHYGPDRIGIDMMVTDTQLLEPEDQVVSVMYEGLSEDDLAFNFLMTYEEQIEG